GVSCIHPGPHNQRLEKEPRLCPASSVCHSTRLEGVGGRAGKPAIGFTDTGARPPWATPPARRGPSRCPPSVPPRRRCVGSAPLWSLARPLLECLVATANPPDEVWWRVRPAGA